MMKKIHLVFINANFLQAIISLIMGAILFSSCKIYKPAYYFKDIRKDTVISGFVTSDMELKIQKNDILAITISSLSTTEDALFNRAVLTGDGKSGFQVGPEGNIYLHKLGKIPVAGLTRKELKAKLEIQLLPYLKDPIVTINFSNHRITVLGESSKLVDMPDEKITLIDVMAQGAAVTQSSQLNKVMVIRETGNTKEIKHLNLEDPSIFTSAWYYLQPNDIVVIKPNEEKIESDQRRLRNQLLYTTVLSGVTFVFLIIDRIFR